MSIDYTDVVPLAKPANLDQAWGAAYRNSIDYLNRLISPTACYYVSPRYTAANLGNGSSTDRRHFDTIQGAIDQFESVQGATAEYGMIMVHPGAYAECITVNKRIGLFAYNPVIGAVQGGGNKPYLCGDGTANPVITVDIDDDITGYLTVVGFSIRNNYNGDTGTELSWPYLLNTVDQGDGNYGAYQNRVKFQWCDFRMESVSNNDAWTKGFHVAANHELKLHDCQIQPMGAADEYMLKPFYLRGNLTTSKTADLVLERCRIRWWGVASESGDYLIDMDNGSSAQVYDGTFPQARADLALVGSNGTNTLLGLESDTEAVRWKNTFGLSAVIW